MRAARQHTWFGPAPEVAARPHSALPVLRLRSETVSLARVDQLLPALTGLLQELVKSNATLGFPAALTEKEARAYWLSLRSELRAGSRLLIAAWWEDRLVGTGQLDFPWWPTARHRVELQKLFVSPALQRQGIGRFLMQSLHLAALRRQRTLVMLHTRHGGSAVRFYEQLGYRRVGVVPGFARGAAGERYDHLWFYREL
jgi:GNAT superfamily N-acetyltransferase